MSICPTCKKPVKGDGVQALGKVYHIDHFQCIKCKKKITEKYQVDAKNEPYCPECAVKHLGLQINICETCKEEIEGKIVKVLGKLYHPDHLLCTECKQPIQGKIASHDDKLYCETCSKKFQEKCNKCQKEVGEKFVKAAGLTFHPECFVCNYCSKSLVNTPFRQYEGVLVCQNCFMEKHAKKCANCNKPIQGEAVEAIGNSYHVDCFVCVRCGAKIKENFAIIDNKPVCKKCAENIP